MYPDLAELEFAEYPMVDSEDENEESLAEVMSCLQVNSKGEIRKAQEHRAGGPTAPAAGHQNP